MSEFDVIEDYEGWNAKLGELLAAATEAAQQDDLATRLAVTERLTQFVISSSPNTAEILALDQIANEARSALLLSAIEDRLRSLAERQGELASLTKKLRMTTEAANAARAALRLDRAHVVAVSLTDSVNSLKEFHALLEEGSDDELIAAIDRLMSAIQRVRSEVEKNG